MPRSILIGLALTLVACARTSDNPPVVTAPVASGSPVPAAGSDAGVASAPSAPSAVASASPAPAGDGMGGPDDADAGAQFRACQSDSDCVAVRRVGCCFNGWMAAVNATQKDAYAKSFTCPTPRPMCPMFMVKDTRVPRCDAATHLCTMVRPQP